MQKGDYLKSILKSLKTVFSIQEIALIWREENRQALFSRLNYYVKRNDLIRLRRGVYAKNKAYNRLELGTKIFKPSYVSLETILLKEGLIFQPRADITLVAYLNRQIKVNNQVFSYRKIKSEILTSPLGIVKEAEFSRASIERAVLDILYLEKDYYFDNLNPVNWEKVWEILPIYKNKRMKRVIKRIHSQFKKGEY